MKSQLFLFCFLFFQFNLTAQDQPNILWIVCEDISPTLSFYGDSTANTPVLNQLAKESTVYENAFACVGVCGPSRSAIITGMYPTSIGTMHMRTAKDITSWGKRIYKDSLPIQDISGNAIRQYSAVPPPDVKCFPEYLRAVGYFCTNNQKTDYQFAAPITAWDQNDSKAHWRNRPAGKPFFSVFNFNETHESQLWKKTKLPLTVDQENVPIPPYLPDTEKSKIDIARHYSNIELLDKRVGKILSQLKADGLYDQTIIFFYSDHGGPLPRQKREIYDSGLKVPFMIKGLDKSVGNRTNQLISFVDLAPSILSLVGIKPPAHLDGKAFLGRYKEQARGYVFGSSDRFDEYTDRIRMIRDKRFLYIRNFLPDLAKYKDVTYRKNIPFMMEMLELKETGKLDELQSIWFQSKVTEELYDCINDPHNLNNLVDDINYQVDLNRLRIQFFTQISQYPDLGQLSEATLINMMWPDNQQPITEMPLLIVKNGLANLTCATPGASIAYILSDDPKADFNLNSPWELYTAPISTNKAKYLYVFAERLGFQASPISKQELK